MAAGTALARSAAVQAEARLGLAEFLLTCDDLEECARRSLEWLAEYAGARGAPAWPWTSSTRGCP
jgi:hypothetical protein